MKLKNQSISLFWTLPFVAFLCGYLLTRTLFCPPTVQVPFLVGLPLAQAAKIASDQQLSIQIIAEKIDTDLKPGTIISQKPQANQTAKHYQIIYLVTAKQPEPKKTPELTGKSVAEITQELNQAGINFKTISLPLNTSLTQVITQYPEAGQQLIEPILVYTAQYTPLYIIPDFKTKPLAEVLTFLETYHIPSTVTYNQPNAHSYTVEQQRPLAGTLISLQQAPTIQLLAKAD